MVIRAYCADEYIQVQTAPIIYEFSFEMEIIVWFYGIMSFMTCVDTLPYECTRSYYNLKTFLIIILFTQDDNTPGLCREDNENMAKFELH